MGASFHWTVDPAFGIDGLSAFFLVVVAATAVPALLYARDALPGARGARSLAALSAAFVLSLVGVLAARDVTTFLAFWELMTLVPAAAILVARRDRAVRRAVFAYLAITHLGGVGVWVALLTLANDGEGPHALVLVAALVGFGTKAGLMPLHSWLPRAHPVAPSHISALMSGVMLKVALYGLIRVLLRVRGAGAGCGSATWCSSLGRALGRRRRPVRARPARAQAAAGASPRSRTSGSSRSRSAPRSCCERRRRRRLGAIAFAAALLHTANHAPFKALLFLAAGAFDRGRRRARARPSRRAAPAHAVDRLVAFLVGCARDRRDPAAERVRLRVADAAGAAARRVRRRDRRRRGRRARHGRAGRHRRASPLFCFVKVVGLVLLGARATPRRRRRGRAAAERSCWRWCSWRRPASLLGAAPGLARRRSWRRSAAPAPRRRRPEPGSTCPARAACRRSRSSSRSRRWPPR